jgi:hypothetical protein
MKTYKKIDIFYQGDYVCSTNKSRTCKEAVTRYVEYIQSKTHTLGGVSLTEKVILRNTKDLRAFFDKSK